MLVLSRRKEEEIVLPGLGITLKVLDVKGKQVRLGVSAPRDVAILRGELVDEDDGDHTPDVNQFPSLEAIDSQIDFVTR